MSTHRRWLTALAAVLAVAAPACGYAMAGQEENSAAEPRAGKPNIIYVLVDDMSSELLKYTDTIAGLARGGTTFTNYYVSNSLCCPSRASMFTGMFPHNTGVRTNKGSDGGGYPAFRKLEDRTYAPALRRRGYRTGYLGKYLNEYPVRRGDGFHVPKGWDEWHVANGGGYNEYRYQLTRYIRALDVRKITRSTGEYLVDELGDRAVRFLRRSRRHAPNRPFFLQVAPFSPHARVHRDGPEPRFPAALRDRPRKVWPKGEFRHGDCGGPRCDRIDVSDLPAFNENVRDKPRWLRNRERITNPPGCAKDPRVRCLRRELHVDFRNRIRMMQSLDDLVARVLGELTRAERRRTYVLFGSDNGFHLGQHRLPRGKGTAYDHDIRVPLLVHRPGGGETVVNRQITQNVDIFATLVDIANGPRRGPTGRDGRSLLPLIRGRTPVDWRDAALVEHTRPNPNAPGPRDPDFEPLARGGPPSYTAVRTATELLVRYAGGAFEYYDTRRDPHQLTNRPDHPRVDELTRPLARLARCGEKDGQPDCWAAAHLD